PWPAAVTSARFPRSRPISRAWPRISQGHRRRAICDETRFHQLHGLHCISDVRQQLLVIAQVKALQVAHDVGKRIREPAPLQPDLLPVASRLAYPKLVRLAVWIIQ